MAVKNLPDHYIQRENIDLSKDKKLAIGINLSAFAIMILMFAGLAMFKFLHSTTFTIRLLPIVLFFIGLVLAMVLHELIHGLLFKFYSRDKIQYGLTLTYAFAGCPDWYFQKKEYIIVGLAPFFLLNLLLLIPLFFLSGELFYVVYFLFTTHFSGCVGDLFVVYKLMKYPPATLVQDTGTAMRFYIPS